jgi:hypothetical protein
LLLFFIFHYVISPYFENFLCADVVVSVDVSGCEDLNLVITLEMGAVPGHIYSLNCMVETVPVFHTFNIFPHIADYF